MSLQTLVTKFDKLLFESSLPKKALAETREGIFRDDELRIVGLKALLQLITAKNNNKTDTDKLTETYKANTLRLVGIIADEAAQSYLENDVKEDVDEDKESGNQKQNQLANYEEFKKQFSEVWTEIMKWEKSQLIHRKILILLPEKVLMHLKKPLHMSDYMLSAFDLGGPLSLLALQGIFILMTRFNFEVADFYTRLYSMFTPSIFHAKYRARFFGYASDFLASTHLPEYLVAAFVKKLSRLSLTAPTPCLPMIFDFITNVIIQHPGLKQMINKENGPQSYDADPFLEDELDPLKTNAINSLLWEIKTLQNHFLPTIASHARFIEQPIPKIQKDLDETLNYDALEIFNLEAKRKKTSRVVSMVDEVPTDIILQF